MRILVALLMGALFGGGLVVSGMTDTTKVQGFLDLFGSWDPTLIFVMGGAIIPMVIAWLLTQRVAHPAFGTAFPDRNITKIDTRLIVGGVLFGFGWGLSGFCPGPAMASLSFGGTASLTFFGAMAAGMAIYPFVRRAAFA